MTTGGDLSVRSHERFKCAIPVELWVGPGSEDRVRLGGAVRNGHGAVSAMVVDCSLGGMGLRSPVYLPRACRVRARILCADAGPEGVAELDLVVQRAGMVDRSPAYYIGASFEDGGAAAGALLGAVRRAARSGEPAGA